MFCGGVFSLNRLQSSVIITSPRQSLLQVIGFIQKQLLHIHVDHCPITVVSLQTCKRHGRIKQAPSKLKHHLWWGWHNLSHCINVVLRTKLIYEAVLSRWLDVLKECDFGHKNLENIAFYGHAETCDSLFVINFEDFYQFQFQINFLHGGWLRQWMMGGGGRWWL